MPAKQFRAVATILWMTALALTAAEPVPARLIKVLPHYLDKEGRHSVSPSLYDRDAYQAFLRRNPEAQSGLRFDVQWKASTDASLTLRIELRGTRSGQPTTARLETSLRRKGWSSRWARVSVRDEAYREFGEMIAWRASLWDGDKLLAEQKSFLW
jgi:hypothetical protein